MATKRLPSAERRKQILHSAIRVFARRSYHGATTRMISQEAGIAEALIYRYFSNKQGLFCEAVEHTGKTMVEGLERCLAEHRDDPRGAVRATLAFYLTLLDRHEDLARMIFIVSGALDDPLVRKVYLKEQHKALECITQAIERWQRQGIMRAQLPARGAAWFFLGTYQTLALMKESGRLGGVVDLDAAVALVEPFFVEQGT